MTEQDFEFLLARGHETNGIEFKGPGMSTDKAFLARSVRAMLGMANRRDGGLVIIGVESASLHPVGLSDDQEASWRDYDTLAEAVNKYASPSVRFEIEGLICRERKIIIVHVDEFEDVPVLCSREFHDPETKNLVLRRGACYVRSRHKPETSEIPSEEEMRELLELAIDKGVRKFVIRAQRAGVFPTFSMPAGPPTDDQAFEDQIEDLA